jgi:molecular chaperone DnaK (HSP70)
VAVVKDGRAVVLADGANRTVPSCLAFQNGKEIVGDIARRQAVTDPKNTVTAVKRLMGHAYESDEVQTARSRVPYSIKPSPLGSVLLQVGGRDLTPVQVSARVLQKIKAVAEQALGHDVERAVISVPAHFNDVQRKATKLAAEYAGLDVLRLINEPTAAAFAYGYRKGEDFTLAVYDLGGGTFDITVMAARGDSFEVVATDGDSYLGGEDFDHTLVAWLHGEFKREFGHDLKGDEVALLRLKEAAERAKIELSDVTEAQIELPYLTQLPDGTRPNFACTLTRDKLHELTAPLVNKTLELCKRCLEEAKVPAKALDEVLLVGGQSRALLVRDGVKEFFEREPRRDINPDEVVAMGAALYAYSLSADALQGEAEGAAEDAYAVALKSSAVARKVVDEIRQLESSSLDLPELRERIKALLAQTGDSAEDELPTPRSQVFGEDALPVRGGLPRLRGSEQADLPTPSLGSLPSPKRASDGDFPEALDGLHDELTDLSAEAQEAIGRLAAEIREEAQSAEGAESAQPATGAAEAPAADVAAELEGLEELSDQLSDKLTERIESAVEKSEEAVEHHSEAVEHKNARRVDLVDVTSLALGISSANDLFSVLIEHNSRVPCEKQRVFTTTQDNQAEVEIQVRQGRAKKASQNQLLGEFILEGIRSAPRMEPKIEVIFHIDEDGILAVTARDQVTKAEQAIRVEDHLGLQQASKGDIERMEREAAEAAAEAAEEAS